jgi:hypothetical protein
MPNASCEQPCSETVQHCLGLLQPLPRYAGRGFHTGLPTVRRLDQRVPVQFGCTSRSVTAIVGPRLVRRAAKEEPSLAHDGEGVSATRSDVKRPLGCGRGDYTDASRTAFATVPLTAALRCNQHEVSNGCSRWAAEICRRPL